jgi:hypothetical protein
MALTVSFTHWFRSHFGYMFYLFLSSVIILLLMNVGSYYICVKSKLWKFYACACKIYSFMFLHDIKRLQWCYGIAYISIKKLPVYMHRAHLSVIIFVKVIFLFLLVYMCKYLCIYRTLVYFIFMQLVSLD